MHELWICKNILEIINQHDMNKSFTCVRKIYLEIGELTAIDKSALLFSFGVVAENSKAKDAILEITSLAGMASCDSCKKTLSINQYSDTCHFCGNFALTILQGEELRVLSMEVE